MLVNMHERNVYERFKSTPSDNAQAIPFPENGIGEEPCFEKKKITPRQILRILLLFFFLFAACQEAPSRGPDKSPPARHAHIVSTYRYRILNSRAISPRSARRLPSTRTTNPRPASLAARVHGPPRLGKAGGARGRGGTRREPWTAAPTNHRRQPPRTPWPAARRATGTAPQMGRQGPSGERARVRQRRRSHTWHGRTGPAGRAVLAGFSRGMESSPSPLCPRLSRGERASGGFVVVDGAWYGPAAQPHIARMGTQAIAGSTLRGAAQA